MRHIRFLVLAAAGVAAPAGSAPAQGLGAYLPTPGPTPGFISSGPIVGTFSPNVPPAAIVPRFGGATVAPRYFPGVGLGGGGFYGGFYGYPYLSNYGYLDPGLNGVGFAAGVGLNGGPSPIPPPPNPVPLIGAGKTDGVQVAVSGVLPARLTVRLPVAGELWVDGKKQDQKAAEYTVTSPPVAAGRSHRFQVKARWTFDGTTYQADRTIDVAAGDRSAVTLVSGDPVNDR